MTSRNSEFKVLGLQALLKSKDPQSFIEGLVRASAQVCGSERASMHLIQPDGQLRPYVLHRYPTEALQTSSTWIIEKICSNRAALHRTLWVVRDVWSEPQAEELAEPATRFGIRSAFSVPVFNRGNECIGTLDCSSSQVYAPSEFTIGILQQIAELIGQAFTMHPELRFVPKVMARGVGDGARYT
jgi:GAF domain-containing protein